MVLDRETLQQIMVAADNMIEAGVVSGERLIRIL